MTMRRTSILIALAALVLLIAGGYLLFRRPLSSPQTAAPSGPIARPLPPVPAPASGTAASAEWDDHLDAALDDLNAAE